MSLADVLRGGVPWGTIASAVAGSFQARVDASSEILHQLAEWGRHMTTNAVTAWSPAIIQPMVCADRGCRATSLVRCDVCHGVFCLGHARISWEARGICEDCVAAATGLPRRRPAPKAPDKYAASLRVLGCGADDDLEAVTAAYRKLVVKYHPDRARTEKKRAEFTVKLRALNDAYAVVRERLERRAA